MADGVDYRTVLPAKHRHHDGSGDGGKISRHDAGIAGGNRDRHAGTRKSSRAAGSSNTRSAGKTGKAYS